VTRITAAFRLIVETYISAAGNAVNRYSVIHSVAVVVKIATRFGHRSPPANLLERKRNHENHQNRGACTDDRGRSVHSYSKSLLGR
jgi:hypothetical protein